MNQKLKEIYTNLNRKELLTELAPEEAGNHLKLLCPACKKKEAFIYLNGISIICNRSNNCGYKETLWNYVQNRYGFSQRDTLLHLAQFAPGVKLDDDTLPQNDPNRYYKRIAEAFQKALFASTNPAYTYLKEERHWTEEEIRSSGIGYHPGTEELKKLLSDIDTSILHTFSFTEPDNPYEKYYNICIPYHYLGHISGLIGRLSKPHDELKKYRFPKNSKVILINFKPMETITIVEGILDAVLSKVRNIPGVCACCSKQLNTTQIDILASHRNHIKRINLLLDNDTAGIKGTFTSIIKLLNKGFTNIYVGAVSEKQKDLEKYLIDTQAQDLSQITFIPYYEWIGKFFPTT